MAECSRSRWTRVWVTLDDVVGSPGQFWLFKNRADTNIISRNVVSQHGFIRLLHLLQKHYSGHLDRRPPNEKGEQKKCIFIISKYLQLRDMKETHLSCDLSGLLLEEDRKKKTNKTIKHKSTILFLFSFAVYLQRKEKKKSGV